MEKKSNESFIGERLDLLNLVEYQESSVVSKTIIDKKVGTISLFAFDQGQGLSEHTAPYDAFVYIFDGEALITISGVPRVGRHNNYFTPF